MAYIKISDPKIIDLPTIHQIINVVNQHSDNISALTNNFGSILSGATTVGATTMYQYDMSSQQILYGVTKFTASSSWSQANNEYVVPVGFVLPFGVQPIVTATVSLTPTGTTKYQDLITRTYADTSKPTGIVNIVLKNPSLALSSTGFITGAASINVNWIAIGHK
jgi:hypothetical protein